jgi:hypothetical protein
MPVLLSIGNALYAIDQITPGDPAASEITRLVPIPHW